jgi:hypothetical protein
MDEPKARDLIQVLVAHHVALVPTFMINYPGYPKDWGRVHRRSPAFFTNPDLLAYYPRECGAVRLAKLRPHGDQGELREHRMKGFVNAMRFHKMFVDAGGHLVVSGNTNDAGCQGVDLHQEMQIMADAGLTPMQIIRARPSIRRKCCARKICWGRSKRASWPM